jgi:hypothetical protein
MELVLIKNKGQIKVYQGTLDYAEKDYYFFATIKDGEMTDIIVRGIDETTGEIFEVPEYTKGALIEILTDEYVAVGV